MNPTAHPQVNQILSLLHSKVREALQDQFVGMYLYGSLATGDFDPASSDIDFVFVTEGILPEATIARLESIHKELWAGKSKWASKLEGSYVPKEIIRRHDPNGHPCPTVNEGQFYVDRRGSDWIIQRHVIREFNSVVEGPDPKTLIDPVSPEDIRAAVMGVLTEWWFPMLENPAWLEERGGEYHAFAVVTMCRVLHALQHGTIVSKPKAAQWTETQFPEWKSLIEKALISQHDPQSKFLDEALDFIKFTKDVTLHRTTAQHDKPKHFNIRPYQDSDWNAICQIHDLARPDELKGSCDPRAFVPIEQDKEVEDLKVSKKFVACDGDKVIGFVGVDGDYLAWLYVHPEYYGKGVGRELLHTGIREIGDGAWTIVLDGNKKAIALYETEGFQEISRFSGDNAGYPCTCLKMKKG